MRAEFLTQNLEPSETTINCYLDVIESKIERSVIVLAMDCPHKSPIRMARLGVEMSDPGDKVCQEVCID